MGHAHDDFIEELGGPGNDFQVTVVHGVEGSGAQGNHAVTSAVSKW